MEMTVQENIKNRKKEILELQEKEESKIREEIEKEYSNLRLSKHKKSQKVKDYDPSNDENYYFYMYVKYSEYENESRRQKQYNIYIGTWDNLKNWKKIMNSYFKKNPEKRFFLEKK